MNSKAIRKQLLAAVAMVLVAAVALGSSTYAWFVASGTVTATGMKVQAQTDAGLAIRYDGGTWGTSATASMSDATKLYPASTTDVQTWYHATADKANSFAAKAGTRTDVTQNVFGGKDGAYADNGYVLMRQFEIRSTSSEALSKGLYVSGITVTTPNGYTMSTALRVGVQFIEKQTNEEGNVTATNYYHRIFAPVSVGDGPANTPTDNYGVYNAGDVQIGTVVLATPNVKDTGNAKNAIIIPETIAIPYTVSNNGLNVNIFIWFEGEDHNLNSNNFNAEDLSVTVDFTSLKTGSQETGASAATNKIDLTASGIQVAEQATAFGGTNYYKITGATALDGTTPLYAGATGALSSTSQIYAITSTGIVTPYTALVKLPSGA